MEQNRQDFLLYIFCERQAYHENSTVAPGVGPFFSFAQFLRVLQRLFVPFYMLITLAPGSFSSMDSHLLPL